MENMRAFMDTNPSGKEALRELIYYRNAWCLQISILIGEIVDEKNISRKPKDA
jgi:hypothetical protein